jgi:dCMP deaminase
MAKAASARSHDAQTQVGCVIVDVDHRVLASGFNGFPPGFPDNRLPNTRPEKYKYVVHAELNAIASSRQDLRGSSLYSTHTPCPDCAKAIITAGIKRVVCETIYANEHTPLAIELFELGRVEVEVFDTSGLPDDLFAWSSGEFKEIKTKPYDPAYDPREYG